MTPPTRPGRNWASKRRSGQRPTACAPGLNATACRGTGPDFPAGERTHDQPGLGGALPEPLFPARAAKSLCADAGPSAGVRGAARWYRDRVSRARAALAGDPRTGQADFPASCGAVHPAESAEGPTEVGTASGASVATGCPARDAEAGLEAGDRRGATAVGLALRFALSAPPCGLRRAALRARPTTTKSKTKNEKGDIFNEVREGTF